MVDAILKLFISEQQVQSLLENQLIEFIFLALFLIFGFAFLFHLILYSRLRHIRHHLETTQSLDIEPLRTFKAEFDEKTQYESIKIETYVQNKFSSWRLFRIPVVNLIKMIQMTVSILILIGVLGTFIGLAMALGNIDGVGDQLVNNIASIITGLDVAFYTSIVGMSFSLIMTVVLRLANTEFMLTDVMLKMESLLEESGLDSTSQLIQVSEKINESIIELRETNQQSLTNIEKAFHGFQEYTIGLQQSAKDLSTFNEGLSANLKDFTRLFTNIKKVTDGLDSSIGKLNKNFDQLFSHFKKMDYRNEQMAQAFSNTYKKIEELTSRQMETLNQFQESVGSWKEYMNGIASRQEAIYGSFERLQAQNEAFVRLMKENNQQFKGIFGQDMSSKLSSMNGYLKELRSDFDKLGNSIVLLPDALETINMAQGEYKHLMQDRFEELKQFNQEFKQHLRGHVTQAASLEKQMSNTAMTFEQMNGKNSQFLQELNRAIDQLSLSFQQRENHLESSVDVLKDTLSRYVANLEGSLGEKLDKVARNLNDYVADMNDAVKKEFKQIGDVTEETQQRAARHTQQTISELSQEFQQLNRLLQSFAQETMRQTQPGMRVGSNDR